MSDPLPNRLAALVAGAAAAVVLGLLLYAVGQPLFTDDLWWHLAWGHAHLAQGPWLEADPLLFTAPGPPASSAWLAEALFAGVERIAGFQALRGLHIALVLGILGLAATTMRRVSGSWCFAWVATAAFAALAAYRLVQLRPHLFSVLGVLLIYALLFRSRDVPTVGRRLGAVFVTLLWANLHAGFLLSPILILGASAAAGLEALGGSEAERESAGARCRGLAMTGALCLAASFFNPLGPAAWTPYFLAGDSTPALGRVGDEWVGLRPFHWPDSGHPSPFVWVGLWTLFLAWLVLMARWLGARRRGEPAHVSLVDLALSGVAFVLAVSAVRFAWLGILPLLAIARALAPGRSLLSGVRAPALALLAFAILATFVSVGDWRAISGFRRLPARTYRDPYPAAKYHAHAVWLMRDAEIEGRLFNDYSLGGFLGYWLAPRVKTFVNGSLNVRPDAISANRPLYQRQGARAGESFLDSLDRLEIDLFLGLGPPVAPAPGQPPRYTAGHLEDAPGWTLAFRNMLTALYVRHDGPRGQANLQQLADYYERASVPFDTDRGFEPGVVLREAPAWSREHGLVPVDFPSLEARIASNDRLSGALALDRIASVYSSLGEHDAAFEVDRELIRRTPDAPLARRRLVWNASWRRDFESVRTFAARWREEEGIPRDPLLEHVLEVMSRADDLGPDRLSAAIATMPLFAPADLQRAMARVRHPRPRPSPRGPRANESAAAPFPSAADEFEVGTVVEDELVEPRAGDR